MDFWMGGFIRKGTGMGIKLNNLFFPKTVGVGWDSLGQVGLALEEDGKDSAVPPGLVANKGRPTQP
jgi:hypothetical protein